MPLKSIAAHYDGQQVRFDEQVIIPPHTRLLGTILEDGDPDRQAFLALASAASAAFADSYDEDEVDYTEADLKR